MISAIRRLLVLFLLAAWWGGFTFYALAVIPSGHEVLHSRVKQGFITRSVTTKLNWLGVVAIAASLSEVLAARARRGRFRLLLTAWLICLVTQVALFWIHACMDGLLDPAAMAVIDQDRFESLHLLYLWPATIGWFGSGTILAMLAWPFPRNAAVVEGK